MDFQEKRVLVTGAGGFIGSHLVDELIGQGALVTAFIHYNSRNDWGLLEGRYTGDCKNLIITTGDITDPFSVRKAVKDQEIVFHLAALIGIPYSYNAPESYVRTNIMGTTNVLQAAMGTDIERIIHTSTSEVYGTAQYTPIDEKHPLQGQSPYSASKIGADKIAESYFCSFGLPVATLRPFNTFGPRQSARAIIPTIITQALTSDLIKIGSPNPVRDLTFVKDTVKAFLAIASSGSSIGKTIHIGTGRGITIGELAILIKDLINPKAQILSEESRIRPEHSEVMKLICDNSRARDLLGWAPEMRLEDGLSLTINWIKENISSYKPGIYTV
jgi:NAD dependent epimerase/dehydratase